MPWTENLSSLYTEAQIHTISYKQVGTVIPSWKLQTRAVNGKGPSSPPASDACVRANAPPCSMDVQQPKHARPPKGSSAIFDCIFQLQEFDTNVPVDHTESHPPHRSPSRCCQPDLGIRLTTSAAPAKTCEHTPRMQFQSDLLARAVEAFHLHSPWGDVAKQSSWPDASRHENIISKSQHHDISHQRCNTTLQITHKYTQIATNYTQIATKSAVPRSHKTSAQTRNCGAQVCQ